MPDRLVVDLAADGHVRVEVQLEGDVVGSPAGEPVPWSVPFFEGDLDQLRWYLEDYLQAPFGVYEAQGPSVAARLADWGERLFSSVFGSGAGRDAYLRVRAREHIGSELYVRSADPRWLGLPWELLRDPRHPTPLALELDAVGRMLPAGALPDSVGVTGEALRVLMVIARPAGLDDVGYGMIARPLLERVEAVRGRVEVEVLRPPTLAALRSRLAEAAAAGEPFQVVHFDGHGVMGRRRPVGADDGPPVMFRHPAVEGLVLFEDDDGGRDPVPASDFAETLRAGRVPVVVLNACQSGALGDETRAAVATRLLAEGTSSVVAMGYSVYVVAAAEFMTAFYDGLFSGSSVAAAVREGRQRMSRNRMRPSPKGMLDLEDWMVPVHYLRREVSFPYLHREEPASRMAVPTLDAILDRLRPGQHGGRGVDGRDPLAPVGRFVGRDGAFFELEVATRHHRVVILHGPGGTGKTEVAKAFGRWLRDTGGLDHPDGVVFHSFEPGVASFGLEGVLTGIGLQLFGAGFAVLDEGRRRAAVVEALRESRLLLVWDNFETVHSMPDPGQATPPLTDDEQAELRAFVDDVAAPGGRSAIIITSRSHEPWLGDRRRMALGGLWPQEAAEYAEDLLRGYPRAQAKRQQRTFAELVAWLEGHPLAMRLILPQLERTEPAELLAALQGQGPLPDGFETEAGRTRSLAASAHYSLIHLDEQTRRLLPAVSLFESVVDIDVLAILSQLETSPARFRDVTRDRWGEVMDTAAAVGLLTPLGRGMYRVHPALPAYVSAEWRNADPERYDADRTATLQSLLAAYVVFSRWLLDQIHAGDAGLAYSCIELQGRTLGRLLRSALDHGDWSSALTLLVPLDSAWDARGRYEEARHWVDRIQLATEDPTDGPPPFDSQPGALWLFAVGSQANRALRAHRLDDAHAIHDAIRASLEAVPESPQRDDYLATSFHQLGMVAQVRGDLAGAEDWYRRALAYRERHGNQGGVAASYHQLGTVAQDRGHMNEAEDWYRKSLTIKEELGNRPTMALTQHQLGMIAQDRGDLDEAEDWYRKSLSIKEEHGDRPGAATSFHQLGTVAQDRGDLDDAESWYLRSLTIEEQLGNRPGIATSYHQLGMVAQQRHDLDGADAWYHRGLAIRERLGDQPAMARSYHQLGTVAQDRGNLDGAEDWYRRSLAIEQQLGNRPGLIPSYHRLGVIAQARGDLDGAERWYLAALEVEEQLGDQVGMAFTLALLVSLAAAGGRTDDEWAYAIRSASAFDTISHPAVRPALAALARLTARHGEAALVRAWQTATGGDPPVAALDAVRAEIRAVEDGRTGPIGHDGGEGRA